MKHNTLYKIHILISPGSIIYFSICVCLFYALKLLLRLKGATGLSHVGGLVLVMLGKTALIVLSCLHCFTSI